MSTNGISTRVSALLSHRWQKNVLWAVMGAAFLSVVFYSEIPLLRSPRERWFLVYMNGLIWTHIAAGTVAVLTGPPQFSSRLRRSNPKLHRVLGRVYVGSVFIAASLAIIMVLRTHPPQAIYYYIAIITQAGTWLIATAAAFLTARNRHIQQHREWMVRSYAVTFTFVATRVLQPIPVWDRFSRVGFATMIILFTFAAILLSDLALHWHQLTTRRS